MVATGPDSRFVGSAERSIAGDWRRQINDKYSETVLDWSIEMVSWTSDTATVLGGAAASIASPRETTETNVAGQLAAA